MRSRSWIQRAEDEGESHTTVVAALDAERERQLQHGEGSDCYAPHNAEDKLSTEMGSDVLVDQLALKEAILGGGYYSCTA